MATEADIPAPTCETRREESGDVVDQATNISINKLPQEEKIPVDTRNEPLLITEGEIFFITPSVVEVLSEVNSVSSDANKVTEKPIEKEILTNEWTFSKGIQQNAEKVETQLSEDTTSDHHGKNDSDVEKLNVQVKTDNNISSDIASDVSKEGECPNDQNTMTSEQEGLDNERSIAEKLDTSADVTSQENIAFMETINDATSNSDDLQSKNRERTIDAVDKEKEVPERFSTIPSCPEEGVSENLQGVTSDNMDRKTTEVDMKKEVLENFSTVSNEKIEENSTIKVDGSEIKNTEDSGKERKEASSESHLAGKASDVEARIEEEPREAESCENERNVETKLEAELEKPKDSLYVASQDVQESDLVLDEKTEDKTVDAAEIREEPLENVGVVSYEKNEENSTTQVDGTELKDEDLEKESEKSSLIKEDENTGKAELLPKDKSTETSLLKEEVQTDKQVESLHLDVEDIKSSDSTIEANVLVEHSLTENPQGIQGDETEEKKVDAADTDEKNQELQQNVATTIPDEHTEENLVIQMDCSAMEREGHLVNKSETPPSTIKVDGSDMKDTEDLGKGSEETSSQLHLAGKASDVEGRIEEGELREAESCENEKSADTTSLRIEGELREAESCENEKSAETTSLKIEVELGKPNNPLHVASQDIKASDFLLDGKTGDKTVDAAEIKEDCSGMEHEEHLEKESGTTSLTEAPKEENNDNKSKNMHEHENRDADVKAQLLENEKHTARNLVKEEAQLEKPTELSQIATKDVNEYDSSQDRKMSSMEEQILITDAQVSGDNIEEKTFDAVETKEETLEEIVANVPDGDNEDSSPIEETGSKKPSLGEASTCNVNDDESTITRKAKSVEEKEVEKPIDSLQVVTEATKASASGQDTETCPVEEQIPATKNILDENTDRKTIDLPHKNENIATTIQHEDTQEDSFIQVDCSEKELLKKESENPSLNEAATVETNEEKSKSKGESENRDDDVIKNEPSENETTSIVVKEEAPLEKHIDSSQVDNENTKGNTMEEVPVEKAIESVQGAPGKKILTAEEILGDDREEKPIDMPYKTDETPQNVANENAHENLIIQADCSKTEETNEGEPRNIHEPEIRNDDVIKAELLENEKYTSTLMKKEAHLEKPINSSQVDTEGINECDSSQDTKMYSIEEQIPSVEPQQISSGEIKEKTIDATETKEEILEEIAAKVPSGENEDNLPIEEDGLQNPSPEEASTLSTNDNEPTIMHEATNVRNKDNEDSSRIKENGLEKTSSSETLTCNVNEEDSTIMHEGKFEDGSSKKDDLLEHEKNIEYTVVKEEISEDIREFDSVEDIEMSSLKEQSMTANCQEIIGEDTKEKKDDATSMKEQAPRDENVSTVIAYEDKEEKSPEQDDCSQLEHHQSESEIPSLTEAPPTITEESTLIIKDVEVEELVDSLQVASEDSGDIQAAASFQNTETSSNKEQILTTDPRHIACDNTEGKTIHAADMNEEAEEVQNVAATLSHEDIEENSLNQVDCREMEQKEHLERESENLSLTKAPTQYTIVTALVKEETQLEKAIDSFQVASEDVKASSSGLGLETSSVDEQIQTANQQEILGDNIDEKTIDAVCKEKEIREDTATKVSNGDDKYSLPIKVDESEKPSSEKASMGDATDNEPTVTYEAKFADENLIKAELSENEKDIEHVLVKEEESIESVQVRAEDISTFGQDRETSSLDEQSLTPKPREITCDHKEDKTTHATKRTEETPENENVATTAPQEGIEENAIIQEDFSEIGHEEHLEKESENSSSKETPNVKEEITEDTKLSASNQDTEISFMDETIQTKLLQENSRDNEEKTIDTTETKEETLEVQVSREIESVDIKAETTELKEEGYLNNLQMTTAVNVAAHEEQGSDSSAIKISDPDVSKDMVVDIAEDPNCRQEESSIPNVSEEHINISKNVADVTSLAFEASELNCDHKFVEEANSCSDTTNAEKIGVLDDDSITAPSNENLVQKEAKESTKAEAQVPDGEEEVKLIQQEPEPRTDPKEIEEELPLSASCNSSESNRVYGEEEKSTDYCKEISESSDSVALEEAPSSNVALEELSTSNPVQESTRIMEQGQSCDIISKAEEEKTNAENLEAAVQINSVAEDRSEPKETTIVDISSNKNLQVSKEIDNVDIKAKTPGFNEEEGYLNDLQMTTSVNETVRVEQGSDSSDIKIPNVTKDMVVDIVEDPNCKREESSIPNVLEEHINISKNVADVTSLAPEASDPNSDHEVIEEADSCSGKTNTEKIGVLDDGSIKVPSNDNLVDIEAKESTEAEAKVPCEEKQVELIQEEPKAGTDQKEIEEELPISAFHHVSESNRVYGEEEKSSGYCKEISESSDSVVLEEVSSFNVASEELSTSNPVQESTRVANEEAQKQDENQHVLAPINDSSMEKIEKDEQFCLTIVQVSDITQGMQKLEEASGSSADEKKEEMVEETDHKKREAVENSTKDRNIEHLEYDETTKSFLYDQKPTESEQEEKECKTEKVLLDEIVGKMKESTSVPGANDFLTSSSMEPSEAERVLKADITESAISLEDNLIDSRSTVDLETKIVDEALEITETTPTVTEGQEIKSGSIGETSVLISQCEKDEYKHASVGSMIQDKSDPNEVEFAYGENKSGHESEDQVLESIAQGQSCDIISEAEEEKTGTENLEAAVEITSVAEDRSEPTETTIVDISSNKVSKGIENVYIKAKTTEFNEEEGYINNHQMTTSDNVAAHEEQSSDLSAIKIPNANKDAIVDIVEDPNCKQEESSIPNVSEEHINISKNVPDVTSLASEASELNSDRTLIGEADSSGDTTDTEKVGVLDDGSITVPLKDNLAETESKESKEAEAQVPDGEKVELIQQEPEAGTVQKEIEEELPISASHDGSESNRMNREEEKSSYYYKEISQSSDSVALREGLSSTTNVAPQELSTSNPVQESTRVIKQEVVDEEAQKQDEDLHILAPINDSSVEKIEKTRGPSSDEKIEEIIEKTDNKESEAVDDSTQDKYIEHLKLDDTTKSFLDEQKSTESEQDEKECKGERVLLDEPVGEMKESTSVPGANNLLSSSTEPSEAKKVLKAGPAEGAVSLEDSLINSKSIVDLETKTVDEALEITETTPTVTEDQEIKSGNIGETSILISQCAKDEYEHASAEFACGENKTGHESKNQLSESIAQGQSCDIILKAEEKRTDEENLEAAAEINSVAEDRSEPKETTRVDISSNKDGKMQIKGADELVEDYHLGFCKEEVIIKNCQEEVKQEEKINTEEILDEVIKNADDTEKVLKVSEEADDKAIVEPKDNLLDRSLHLEECTKGVEGSITALQKKEIQVSDNTHIETGTEDSIKEVNSSSVAFLEDGNNRKGADGIDNDLEKDEGLLNQTSDSPVLDAAALRQGLHENIICDAATKKIVQKTTGGSEDKKENANATAMEQQEEGHISKHESLPLPELASGNESEKQDQKYEICGSHEVQANDEENQMISMGSEEAHEADICSEPDENEDRNNYAKAEKLEFSSHPTKDASDVSHSDGATHVTPEDNKDSTTINKCSEEEYQYKITESQIPTVSKDIEQIEEGPKATEITSEMQETVAGSYSSAPEAEDKVTELHDLPQESDVVGSEVEMSQRDGPLDLQRVTDVSKDVQKLKEESFDVSNKDNLVVASLNEEIETTVSSEGQEAIQKASVSDTFRAEIEQQLERTFEAVTEAKGANRKEEKTRADECSDLIETSCGTVTEMVSKSNIHQSSVEDTAHSDVENKESQQQTVLVATSPPEKDKHAIPEADHTKNANPEDSLGNKNIAVIQHGSSAECSQGEGEVSKPSEQEEAHCGHVEEKTSQETTKSSDKSESKETYKSSLSDVLQVSVKETSQMAYHSAIEKEPIIHTEKTDEAELEDTKTAEGKDEEEESGHRRRSDLGSEAPVVVDAGDADVKVTHKKSHNILSGVGSKVKHSIAKVKKAITGKSSHPKPPSPKEGYKYSKATVS